MKAALQVPEVAGPSFDAVPPEAYTDPDYAAVAAAVAGGRGRRGRDRHRPGLAGRGRRALLAGVGAGAC